MDDESVITFDKILERLDYDHAKNSNSKRTKSFSTDVRKRLNEFSNPTLALPADKNIDLEGHVLKNIIPSNIIDVYTRLEVLLGLKVSGHTDTLTEASNLIDEL